MAVVIMSNYFPVAARICCLGERRARASPPYGGRSSASCLLTISTVHGPMRVGLQLVEDEDEISFQFSHFSAQRRNQSPETRSPERQGRVQGCVVDCRACLPRCNALGREGVWWRRAALARELVVHHLPGRLVRPAAARATLFQLLTNMTIKSN